MQNSLHQHVLYLESRIQELSDQLTRPCEACVRERMVAEVQAARLALDYYRKAFQLEQEVAYFSAADPIGPNSPGSLLPDS
jgi:hypothetical protein